MAIVFGHYVVGCLLYSCLWLVSLQLCSVVMGSNMNRYCLNLQGYLECTVLLSHILTEWIFLFLLYIPKQAGNKVK